ncbi:MAG: GTP-binding protein, partial [Planctomycetota bacterium]
PDWHPYFGDRRQTLVFIGVGLDEPKLREHLAECLMTSEELAASVGSLEVIPDPFPAVEMHRGEESTVKS